jgi:hypothetical protein
MRNPRTEKGRNSKLGWNSRDTSSVTNRYLHSSHEGKWLNVGCIPLFHPQRRRVAALRVSMRAIAFTQPHLPGGIGLKCRTCGWHRKHAHGPASSTRQDHAHHPSSFAD